MRGVSARSCDYDELVGAAAGFCPSMGVLGSSFTPLASATGSSESSSESVRPGRLGGFACLPSADGLASFLCEPVSFGSCAWSDAPCGGETEYAATRSASSSLGAGENGAGGGRAGDLVLTTPSRASYVDLRYGSKDDGESRGSSGLGADEAGDGSTAAEGRRRFDEDGGSNNPRGLIHQTRETIAALAALGVAALLMTTRVARAYVLDPIFSPVVSPTVLNSVGIDPQTPLTPAEERSTTEGWTSQTIDEPHARLPCTTLPHELHGVDTAPFFLGCYLDTPLAATTFGSSMSASFFRPARMRCSTACRSRGSRCLCRSNSARMAASIPARASGDLRRAARRSARWRDRACLARPLRRVPMRVETKTRGAVKMLSRDVIWDEDE